DENHKIIAISRNEQLLLSLCTECNKTASEERVFGFSFDLLDIGVKKDDFLAEIKARFDHIDILINNAGYLSNKAFETLLPEDMKQTLGVNYTAPLLTIQALLPLLKNSKHAHVLNIGTMGGVQGSSKFPGLSIYSSSKAALATLTECLAEEYKESKISFNYLALGAVQTEMLEKAFPGYKAPLSAKEMAEFISNFAINGHKYFNGKILPVSLSTP
ncbi:MAG: SDR family oxidoreductase, partial [Bacteroidales bacterium]|nr:SDR family oxidoreductase [Bacteroidales bacterium]